MGKKAKIVWTKALHKKFVQAVEMLGVDKAVPKKIVKLMEVDGLTRDHVASHLQKYRLVIKSTSDKDSCNQAASKPSSMNNGVSWNNFSLMPNQEKRNLASYNIMDANHPPILDTSSSYFSILEASSFNATTSSSLPYEGYSMTNNLDQQRNSMNDSTDLDVVNCLDSSNSGFIDFIYDYGGCSTEVQIYNNYEIGSSSGGQNFSNSSVLHNPNGFECNYSSQSGFVEMNSLNGTNLNCDLENGMGKDDLMLNEADIASLLSYVDDNGESGGTSDNLPITFDLPNQDANGDNFQNIVTLDSNHNELTSINKHQTSDEYLQGFDPNFNMYNISEHMKPMWSPDPITDEMTLEGLNFNSYVQD